MDVGFNSEAGENVMRRGGKRLVLAAVVAGSVLAWTSSAHATLPSTGWSAPRGLYLKIYSSTGPRSALVSSTGKETLNRRPILLNASNTAAGPRRLFQLRP